MSANIKPLVATIYNPQNQSKDALIAGFIARKQKFERLFRDVRNAPMTKPEQHYLIQGVRGMGKTTFLLRIAYEIENTPDLRERLIPVVFNEEEYGISSLADVWERTAQYVEEADSSFAGLPDSITSQHGQPEYEQRALQTLVDALRHHSKKLLILIDNIGDLLKKLDKQEEQRLREVLLTMPELRLIGATSVVIEQAHDYSRPFYEFFKVIHLEGLSKPESIDLFLKLGETYHADVIQKIIEQQPGRIEAIRRLTGGVIRTMVLLFEILVENNTGSVFRDLNVLLDRVTPLYKHRMDDLPAQQQKIVAALATAWDAASAKELAQVVRLESKVVSAQLKQLIDNSVVERVETKTKNHLYRLEERFFNIWYLMRFGRKTDQRVLWLVRFFEEMFGGNPEWMQERIDGHLQAMQAGTLDAEAALYLTTAFASVVKDEEMEDLLKSTTRSYLTNSSRHELIPKIQPSSYERVSKLMQEELYEEALKLLNKFNKKKENVTLDVATCCLFLNKNLLALNSTLASFRNNDSFNKVKLVGGDESKPNKHLSLFVNEIVLFNYLKNRNTIYSKPGIASVIALQYFYYCKNRREVSLKLIERFVSNNANIQQSDPQIAFVKNIVYALNNDFTNIDKRLPNPFDFSIEVEEFYKATRKVKATKLGQTYLKLLLAKKQYHTAYNYFQQEEWQLKDRFKPLYYATLHFLRDEYPTEYLRMGPELKETVDDVLAEIAQMAIDYA